MRGASVKIDGISKSYGSMKALDNVSLDISQGEFIALLGPSGSGKSTLLMSLAGFETPDRGTISVGGRTIDKLPPFRRDLGMVFQRYALFPHMTVGENLAYPLRRRGVRSGEIKEQIQEALSLVKLDGLEGRRTDQLSGGQQQRVAVARALIAKPSVLLMDEPMSALDKKLRQQMQIELKLLHRKVGTTIILVTHDQEEALSMADRVAILNHGTIRQVDSPEKLYNAPADAFVADFIGRTNFLPLDKGHACTISGFGESCQQALATDSPNPATGGYLGVRPENLMLSESGPGEPCKVVETAFLGSTQDVLIEAAGHTMTVETNVSSRLWEQGDTAYVSFVEQKSRIYSTLS